MGLSRDGKFDQACRLYDEILKLAPWRADVWFDKGTTLNRLGRNTAALAAFDKALELSPADADIWANKGKVLEELGLPLRAAEAYELAVQSSPRHAVALFNLGSLYSNTEQYGRAADCLRRVLELNPMDHDALLLFGVALCNTGELSEAEEMLNRALEISPNKEVVAELIRSAGLKIRTPSVLKRTAPSVSAGIGKTVRLPKEKSYDAVCGFLNSLEVTCPNCNRTGSLVCNAPYCGLVSHERFGAAASGNCLHCGAGILVLIQDDKIAQVSPIASEDELSAKILELLR